MFITKNKFSLWFRIQNKLPTREKLFEIGVCKVDICCICGQYAKTHNHLFFYFCVYLKRLIIAAFIWIRVNFRVRNLAQ